MNAPNSMFHGYVRRLSQSSNPLERDSLYLGYTVPKQRPVLVPVEMLFEHMHILGAPGTGKSALGIAPLMTQLIRRNDGPVIVLDLKGDMALFNTAKIETQATRRKFKWFTNKPNRSTYVFNPWQQGYLQSLTVQELLGLFLLSLNLHHGEDYGRGYFSLKARSLFGAAINVALNTQQGPVRQRSQSTQSLPSSFRMLKQMIEDLPASFEDRRSGEQLIYVLESLVDIPQLNFAVNDATAGEAVKHAIHMPDVIRENQVVYFYLQALMDHTTVAEIARLVMYAALTAAVAYRQQTGRRPRVYLIADEAQHLVAYNIANVMAQAREYGLACVLAHQSMSQLNPPGGVDLRSLVMSCTSIKQFWSVRDPMERDYVSKISGEVPYYSQSWDQLPNELDKISRQRAVGGRDRPASVHIAESVGPRLTSQDIEDYSRMPNVSMMAIERNAGLSCFQGAFPVHMDWLVPQHEHHRRNLEIPWPSPDAETIVAPDIGQLLLQHQHANQEPEAEDLPPSFDSRNDAPVKHKLGKMFDAVRKKRDRKP